MRKKLALAIGVCIGLGTLLGGTAAAAESKVLLSENFDSGKLAESYVPFNGEWSIKDGVLSQTSLDRADPTKVIFPLEDPPMDIQITAKVKVDSWVEHDMARAGVSLRSNVDDGYGYNLLFHQDHERVQFLDDMRAWGESFEFAWEEGVWYWFKMKIVGDEIYGKVWKDGTPEPKDWPFVQDSWSLDREGFPAVNGGSSNGEDGATASFDNVVISTPED